MVILWLLYGYYIVNIWLLYGLAWRSTTFSLGYFVQVWVIIGPKSGNYCP